MQLKERVNSETIQLNFPNNMMDLLKQDISRDTRIMLYHRRQKSIEGKF